MSKSKQVKPEITEESISEELTETVDLGNIFGNKIVKDESIEINGKIVTKVTDINGATFII